jgi:hypothetical protein
VAGEAFFGAYIILEDRRSDGYFLRLVVDVARRCGLTTLLNGTDAVKRRINNTPRVDSCGAAEPEIARRVVARVED